MGGSFWYGSFGGTGGQRMLPGVGVDYYHTGYNSYNKGAKNTTPNKGKGKKQGKQASPDSHGVKKNPCEYTLQRVVVGRQNDAGKSWSEGVYLEPHPSREGETEGSAGLSEQNTPASSCENFSFRSQRPRYQVDSELHESISAVALDA
ncbi:unnamed protein product, partial [Amoebophrya sp. A120]|eukprot:GSA120T00003695001.1